MSKILIIEDDIVFSRALRNWLEKENMQVVWSSCVAKARRMIEEHGDADLVLSDMRLPDGNGVDILEWMNKQGCRIPFVIMTQHAEVLSAVRAMKLGAEDYLPKPFLPEALYTVIRDLLHRKKRVVQPNSVIFQRKSEAFQELERVTKLVAKSDMSVLIRGENGTGKEYFAESIHKNSQRSHRPFIAVDCGAIPKELAASEFFGHVKGAFTGASDIKYGVFHEADGGTLFLDEIGNLPYEVQMLLLRALHERRYRPVGGKREVTCDVRIVAATNENIEKAIVEGRFREDLFHRLNELPMLVPSLRECPEDIIPLAEFFLHQSVEELKREPLSFSGEAKKRMLVHTWAGNVRELKNTIRKAALLAEGKTIEVKDLNLPQSKFAVQLSSENMERREILRALESVKYNKTLAAEKLGINRSTLYEKMKKHGL